MKPLEAMVLLRTQWLTWLHCQLERVASSLRWMQSMRQQPNNQQPAPPMTLANPLSTTLMRVIHKVKVAIAMRVLMVAIVIRMLMTMIMCL